MNIHRGYTPYLQKGQATNTSQCVIVINLFSNEIADQLAKEAEALELDTQVFTKQDIRKAVRDADTKKWQVRWDSSNSGRHYYRFHKVVKDKVKKICQTRDYTLLLTV